MMTLMYDDVSAPFSDVSHVLQKEGDQTAEVLALPSAKIKASSCN